MELSAKTIKAIKSLTPLERKVFDALLRSMEGNGYDFGYSNDAAKNRAEIGALGSLTKKLGHLLDFYRESVNGQYVVYQVLPSAEFEESPREFVAELAKL